MDATQITPQHFKSLQEKFGNHSKAARALGTTPNHYSFVRRTGRMSGPLRALILELCADESGHPLPSPTQPDRQEA